MRHRRRRRRKVKRSIHADAVSASAVERRAVPFKAFPPPSLPPSDGGTIQRRGAGPPDAVSIRRLICLSFVIHVNETNCALKRKDMYSSPLDYRLHQWSNCYLKRVRVRDLDDTGGGRVD